MTSMRVRRVRRCGRLPEQARACLPIHTHTPTHAHLVEPQPLHAAGRRQQPRRHALRVKGGRQHAAALRAGGATRHGRRRQRVCRLEVVGAVARERDRTA